MGTFTWPQAEKSSDTRKSESESEGVQGVKKERVSGRKRKRIFCDSSEAATHSLTDSFFHYQNFNTRNNSYVHIISSLFLPPLFLLSSFPSYLLSLPPFIFFPFLPSFSFPSSLHFLSSPSSNDEFS